MEYLQKRSFFPNRSTYLIGCFFNVKPLFVQSCSKKHGRSCIGNVSINIQNIRVYKIPKVHLHPCQLLYLERSVYACLPATLLCASTQKLRAILFTCYLCNLTMCFRCFNVRDLRIYGTVLSLYVLFVICRPYQGMKWFSRAIT